MVQTALKYIWKIIQFSFIGVSIAILGGIILDSLIKAGFNPTIAYLIQAIFSIESNFLSNNRFTWKERREQPLWKRWWRFHQVRALTFTFNTSVFFVATDVFNLPHMPVYVALVLLIAIFSFISNEKYVFKGE